MYSAPKARYSLCALVVLWWLFFFLPFASRRRPGWPPEFKSEPVTARRQRLTCIHQILEIQDRPGQRQLPKGVACSSPGAQALGTNAETRGTPEGWHESKTPDIRRWFMPPASRQVGQVGLGKWGQVGGKWASGVSVNCAVLRYQVKRPLSCIVRAEFAEFCRLMMPLLPG